MTQEAHCLGFSFVDYNVKQNTETAAVSPETKGLFYKKIKH